MKKTRRSLFTSLAVLLLCSAMFVGSTFAWFTDTVSNTGNKIQAGTLDIGLEQFKKTTAHPGGEWVDLEEVTDPVFDYDKWEPGYSDGGVFKIVNKGNLALKYTLQVVMANGTLVVNDKGHSLADVIDVYYAESDTITLPDSFDDAKSQMTKVGTLADIINSTDIDGFAHGVLLPAVDKQATNSELPAKYTEEAKTEKTCVAIVLHMQEEAGNEYQGMSLGTSFDIRLLATQVEYEKDGFDSNLYDEQAEIKPLPNPVHVEVESSDIDKTKDGDATAQFSSSGAVKSAEVKMSTVQELLPNVGDPVDSHPIEVSDSVNMKMNLKVDSKEVTDDSVTYEIELYKTVTVTDSSDAQVAQEKTKVEDALTTPVTAILRLESNLKNVKVTHSNEVMEKLASADAIPSNINLGGYHYDTGSGELTIKAAQFSPFKVSYDLIKPEDGDVYNVNQDKYYKTTDDQNALETAIAEVNDGETLLLLNDCTITDTLRTAKNFTLDLGKKTLNLKSSGVLNYGVDSSYNNHSVSELVKNGNIKGDSSSNYIRFEDACSGTFINVTFDFPQVNSNNGPKALNTIANNKTGADTVNSYNFTDCTFNNAPLCFNGNSSSRSNNYQLSFSDCEFNMNNQASNALNLIHIEDYNYGTLNLNNVTFNYEEKSSVTMGYCLYVDTYLDYVNGQKFNVNMNNVTMNTFGAAQPYSYRFMTYNSNYSDNAVITETGTKTYKHNDKPVQMFIKETSATNKSVAWTESPDDYKACLAEWVKYANASPACANYSYFNYYLVECNDHYYIGGQGQQFNDNATVTKDGDTITQVVVSGSYTTTYKNIGTIDISTQLGDIDNTSVHIYTMATK